jgi:peroxin-19
MLDEFSSTSIQPRPDAPSASGPGRPPSSEAATAAEAEDFHQALQREMAALMNQIDESPEMRKQFETMMRSISGERPPDLHATAEKLMSPSSPAGAGPSASATAPPSQDAFQASIHRTMERLTASDTSVSAAANAPPDEPEDLLASVLQELSSADNEEDFSKMLLGMMEQLTDKEVLYEPMKELHEKFPGWMETEGKTCKEEDAKRYREQQVLVGQIVWRFEREEYSDENAEDREFIVGRMQKVSAGSGEWAKERLADLPADAGIGQPAYRPGWRYEGDAGRCRASGRWWLRSAVTGASILIVCIHATIFCI